MGERISVGKYNGHVFISFFGPQIEGSIDRGSIKNG